MKAVFLTGILVIAVVGGTGVYSMMTEDPINESGADFVFIAPIKWNRTVRGAMAAEEEFDVSVKYITFSQDEERQIEAMRYALLSDADGIITAGMQVSEKLEETVQQVQKEGIPVVFVDSDIKGSSRECYIGCDNREIGRLAGIAVREAGNGKANFCLVISDKETTSQIEREKGFMEEIEKTSDIHVSSVVEGESNTLVLQKEIPKTLENNPEIDTLVFAEGSSTRYGEKFLRNGGVDISRYHIIAMDHLDEINSLIQDGIYDAAIFQDQFSMGYEAVRYLTDILAGIDREETNIFVPVELITKENVETKEQGQEEPVWYLFQ